MSRHLEGRDSGEAKRPSFDRIWIQMAGLVSGRSTCRRRSVGCVIVSEDNRRVLSLGYNGNATGLPNDCDSDEPGNCGDLHAEANAIVNCVAPREVPKVVYVTDSPCSMCAKMIVNLGGVVRVLFARKYRIEDGLRVLERAEIPWVHFSVESS